MKDDDKVVQLVTSKEPKPSDDEFYGMTDEVREFIEIFTVSAEAYEAVSFAAVAVAPDGEMISTFTSSNANLLSLLGAVAVTQSELLDISKGEYFDE